MEGRVKILETYPKSEEIISFYTQFSNTVSLYSNYIAMFWLRLFLPQSLLSAYITEGKLKILGTNKKSEEIISLHLIFCAFGHFYCDFLKRKRPVCLGCTRTRSPRISTVLLWRPPDVYIFHTDPSLICKQNILNFYKTLFSCNWTTIIKEKLY